MTKIEGSCMGFWYVFYLSYVNFIANLIDFENLWNK